MPALRHVGLIPDGNRRWARARGVNLLEAYLRGLDNLKRILLKLYEYPISSITVYALSYENCIARDMKEKRVVEDVIGKGLRELSSWIERDIVKIRFYGRYYLLSEDLRDLIARLRESIAHSSFTLNVGICYKSGDEESERHLIPPIDLVIRTGGHYRLSGFFPSLSAYAELYVSEKLWPDFNEGDLEEAITWFMRQKRKMGR